MAYSASNDWRMSADGSATTGRAVSRPNVEILRDFASLAPIWQQMTAEGHATPYQSYRFVEGYFRHIEAPQGSEPMLVVLRDAAGEPQMLVPLVIARTGPFRIARFIGGKQANFNMPLFARGAERLTPETVRAALLEAGKMAGVDVFCLHAQPQEWQGFANPLAGIDPLVAPSHGYKLQLASDSEALLKKLLSKDTRRKTRQKKQKLGTFGAVEYRKPSDPEEIRATLECFFALKADRFASQGIADPFSQDDVRTFLREAHLANVDGAPCIELHSLCLDGQPVAMFGAVVDQNRFSGLFTAFASEPNDIARCSPGDILLVHMIKDCCQCGLSTFDLGVGEAHYKSKICNEVETLVETFLPVSARGQAIALGCKAKQGLKRAVKTSELGKKAIAFLRGLRAKG